MGDAVAHPSPVAGVAERIAAAATARAERGNCPVGDHLAAIGQDDLYGTVHQHGSLIGHGDLAADRLSGHAGLQ